MGTVIAFVLICLWAFSLFYGLSIDVTSLSIFVTSLLILVQTYLYTGMFITMHDSIHGVVSKNGSLNRFIGKLCAFLFAGMMYSKLERKHKEHHRYSGTALDPDYFDSVEQGFIKWFLQFIKTYTSIGQIIIMAISYNLLKIYYKEINIVLFWVIPALLSTLQLFYFGTYTPHKKPHSEEMGEHHSRTLPKNHFYAMVTCYFFGYHLEHHKYPMVAWWQLYKLK